MIDQEQTPTSQDHRYLKPKTPFSPPVEREVELFARIKKSSEYYHQGLNQTGKPCIYKIDGIRPDSLAFYVKDTKGNLIPLAGGMSK